MLDRLDCYVVVTLEGPFGEIKQLSGLMRASEAAMTTADILNRRKKEPTIKDARIVRLKTTTS